MAALPELTDLINSDFMKCYLCREPFTEPILLPCLHSVCKPCIEIGTGGQKGVGNKYKRGKEDMKTTRNQVEIVAEQEADTGGDQKMHGTNDGTENRSQNVRDGIEKDGGDQAQKCGGDHSENEVGNHPAINGGDESIDDFDKLEWKAKAPTCPMCHISLPQVDNGHSFQHNHFLASLKELLDCQGEDDKECDYCCYDNKQVTATSRCLQCGDNMCATCSDAHRRTKITRDHKVAPFKEIQLGKYDSDIRAYQYIGCGKHDREPVKFFCMKCEELVCRECRIEVHDKHKCVEIEVAGQTYKAQASTSLTSIQNKLQGLNQYQQFLHSYETHLTDTKKKKVPTATLR